MFLNFLESLRTKHKLLTRKCFPYLKCVYMYVCMYICLSVCLSVFLPICPNNPLSPNWKQVRLYIKVMYSHPGHLSSVTFDRNQQKDVLANVFVICLPCRSLFAIVCPIRDSVNLLTVH